MKYLFVIVALIVISTIITLYAILPKDSQAPTSVKSHGLISEQSAGYHQEKGYERNAAHLTKRVLVQEAQRIGIDKEESFRSSLKDYYEQSLIKVLTERKLAEVQVVIDENDIDLYIACSGKIFTFTRFPVKEGKIIKERGHQNMVLFDDLSVSLRLIIASLHPGESAKQVETGTETSVIRLDAIKTPDRMQPIHYERAVIYEQLQNHQQSLMIESWIHALRKTSATERDEAPTK